MLRRLPPLLLTSAWTLLAPLASHGAEAGASDLSTPEAYSPVDNVPADPAHAPTDANGGAIRGRNALERMWSWGDERVRGVFDYVLPDTLEKLTFRLSFQPRVGDIVKHDHIRLPFSLTYGIGRRTELELGFDPYFGNPFKDGEGEGMANVRASLKHQWQPSVDTKVRAATGFVVVNPLSSAPYEFNDGVNRYSVFQTFARPSPWNPNLEGFVNVSYDFITPSSADGAIDEDDPQNDFYKFGTGVLWRHKRLLYGLAVSYAHTTDGVGTSFTTVTPSVIYDVPSRYVFNSPGQWQVGASVEAKRYGDDNALDFKVRVRWNVDFRRMVRDWREARAARLAAKAP